MNVDVKLHPLVMIAITDHVVRDRLQFKRDKVIGAIYGDQKGNIVDVSEAIGIRLTLENEQVQVDMNGWVIEKDIFLKTFSDVEVLGWYSSGLSSSADELRIHELFAKYCSDPLYIQVDSTAQQPGGKDLGLKVYKRKNDKSGFERVKFSIVQSEMENLTLLHCRDNSLHQPHRKTRQMYNAFFCPNGTSEAVASQSTLQAYSQNVFNATDTLKEQVQIMLRYVTDVESGKIQGNQDILRRIKSLCARLPTNNSEEFNLEFMKEFNDSVLQVYIAQVAKTSVQLFDTIGKFNVDHKIQNTTQNSLKRGKIGFPSPGAW
jgi:hypothetical protein